MEFIEILTIRYYFPFLLWYLITSLDDFLVSILLNIDLKENWTVKVFDFLTFCSEKHTDQYKIRFIEALYKELVSTNIVLASTYYKMCFI